MMSKRKDELIADYIKKLENLIIEMDLTELLNQRADLLKIDKPDEIKKRDVLMAQYEVNSIINPIIHTYGDLLISFDDWGNNTIQVDVEPEPTPEEMLQASLSILNSLSFDGLFLFVNTNMKIFTNYLQKHLTLKMKCVIISITNVIRSKSYEKKKGKD
jgi:hypothetical protein